MTFNLNKPARLTRFLCVCIFLLLVLPSQDTAAQDTSLQVPMDTVGKKTLDYNFTYRFRMDMKGKIMYIVSFRFYYESSASVNFIARKNGDNSWEFCYNGIASPGYVMTTGGRTGTSLYFFTADYDTQRADRFREEQTKRFKEQQPYYRKKIKKLRPRPMTILSAANEEEALRFKRDNNGVQSAASVNMRLTDSHSSTYSNIYEILGELIPAYNHTFLPEGGLETVLSGKTQVWVSKPLDFGPVLTRTSKLTSEYAEKKANFRQKRRFILKYRVVGVHDNYVDICGEAKPKLKVWKGMKINYVSRNIRLRLPDRAVIKDELFLDFMNKKGKGGDVKLVLAARALL